MRIHPPTIEVIRVSWGDDIIPLSKPVVGVSGKVYTELEIPKGTVVTVSQFGHNLWAIPRNDHFFVLTHLVTVQEPRGMGC